MFFLKRIKKNYRLLTERVFNNSAIIELQNQQIQKYQEQLDKTKKELEKTKKEIEKLQKDINEEIKITKDDIRNTNFEIAQDKNHNYIVEKELMNMFKAFEFNFFKKNQALNKVLYEHELELNKTNYNPNFNPKVSIIIPVYNGSGYIKEAIESALNQTYKNIEIIVVNDGSTDGNATKNIVKKYKNKVQYYEKENGGVSSALNYGISKMTGDYFAWLSHDDLFYKNHIEEHINYLKYFYDKRIITYSNFDIIDEKGNIKLDETISCLLNLSDFKISKTTHYSCILEGEINGGGIIIPKKAFEICGLFEEGNRVTQEKDMWSRLLKEYTLINLPITTTSIRSHEKQVTNNTNDIREQTNNKLIEILSNIPDDEMIKESSSIANFYLLLYQHYTNNNIHDLAKVMKEKYEKYKNK